MKLAFYLADKGSVWDRAIAAYTKGPYSHVEFVVEAWNPAWPRATAWPHDKNGSLCYSSSPMAPRHGCGFEYINLDDGKWRTVELPEVDWTPAITLAVSDNGKPYDWRGIVGFVVHGLDNKAERFCSEEVVLMLQAVGMLANFDASRISPNDLARVMGVL